MLLTAAACSNRLSGTSLAHTKRLHTAARAGSSAAAAGGQQRGAFILFEGLDRVGKTTQAALLQEALQHHGVPAQLWVGVDRKTTVTGPVINDFLQGKVDINDHAVHLLFSANRHEKRDALTAALLAGTTLVIDRYAYSGVAYSVAKGGMDVAWCKAPEAGLPAPDLVVYLRVSSDVAAARAGFGEERFEKAEFQDKVRAVFEELIEPEWLVLDGTQPIQQIHEQVLQEALAVVKRCQAGEPIRKLWDHTPLPLPGVNGGDGKQQPGPAAAARAAATAVAAGARQQR